MKVAVAYNNGQIGEHFGHAECFAIYDYQDTNVDSCVKKLIDCTDRHGHQAMADLMRENDVDAVIVSQMGDEARALLLSAGIVPVLGYCGGADMAADMLVSGLLSISPEFDGGGCGGGCGEPYVEMRTFTDIVTLTEENFEDEVLRDPGLIVIDFWAEWCQPCKMMAPIFDELNKEEDKVKFCKINVDEQPNLASMFGIDSIPTLAVVQDRHTLTGMVGVHEKADIKAMLEQCKA